MIMKKVSYSYSYHLIVQRVGFDSGGFSGSGSCSRLAGATWWTCVARRAAVHGAATANRRFWVWRERPGRPSSTGLRRVAASCRHVCDAGCRSTGIGRQCHVMAAFATVARDGCRAVSILILRIASIQIRIRSRGRVSDGYAYGFGQRADRSGSVIGGVLRSHQNLMRIRERA